MPISYKNKIYTTLGTPTVASGNGAFVTNSAGVPAKDYTVKGKSIVWNQLLDKSKYPATGVFDGVTYTNNDDGTITLNGTATAGTDTNYNLQSGISVLTGHKYFCYYPDIIPNSGAYVLLYTVESDVFDSRWPDRSNYIVTALKNYDNVYFQIKVNNGKTVDNLLVKPQLFDLTQMFGAGNEPATPEEFRAMFPDDYYPYNAGELKSIVPTSVEASGVERFQMLDKSKFTATTTIGGVTFTNNGDGTITYNGTPSTLIDYTLQSGLKVVAGHKYFSCVGKNTNGKISVLLYANSDPYNTFDDRFPQAEGGISTALKNSDSLYYQPKPFPNMSFSNFILKPQLFDLTQMFGAANEPATPAEFWQRVPEKLYGYNPNDYKSANIPSSKYFPDGMKSAGSVYDEINFLSQKAIKRIGAVDMGTLNWSYTNVSQFFYTLLPGAYPFGSNVIPNIICSAYEPRIYSLVANISASDGGININGKDFQPIPRLSVKDRRYSSAAAFKAAMSGVMLYYELETPVETAITPPLQALSTFKDFTSFSAPNSLMQNGPLSVTYYAEGGASPEKGWLTSYKRKLYMGRNIEWNQLFTNSVTSWVGVTISNNQDGTMTLNGTVNRTYINFTNLSDAMNRVHKYLLCLKILNNPDGVSLAYGWLNRNGMRTDIISNGESCTIRNQTESATQLGTSSGLSGFEAGTVFNNVKIAVMVMDLTQMFGAGNEPATPEEFWSYFDHKLYPYSPGETQPLFKISRKSRWGGVYIRRAL